MVIPEHDLIFCASGNYSSFIKPCASILLLLLVPQVNIRNVS